MVLGRMIKGMLQWHEPSGLLAFGPAWREEGHGNEVGALLGKPPRNAQSVLACGQNLCDFMVASHLFLGITAR